MEPSHEPPDCPDECELNAAKIYQASAPKNMPDTHRPRRRPTNQLFVPARKIALAGKIYGAGNEARTRDLNLGKIVAQIA